MTLTAGGPASRILREIPAIYFAEAAESFAGALATSGSETPFFFEIGGLRIRLRFAEAALAAKITRTLGHLQIPATPDFDFTLCCWDDQGAGATMPRLPEMFAALDTRHCLRALTDERFHAFYVPGVRILSCLDVEAATGYSCYFDAGHLSMYEVSGPLRPLLNAVLNRRGRQIVHASAVGTPQGSVLFAGPPLSGKSTLAVSALLDGLSYQSDDLCVLSSEAEPRSFSLYNIAKLREDCLPRFPQLAPVVSSFVEDFEKKSYFYVHEQFPQQVLKEAPVKALVLTHVTSQPVSRLLRAPRKAGVVGLMNCTGKEIPMTGITGEGIMFQAINRLPVYDLLIGRDGRALEIVRELLEGKPIISDVPPLADTPGLES
jgi:hypothetical protein